MGTLLDFLFGETEKRSALPLNSPLLNTVPIQHSSNRGTEPIRKLPVVRKCLGYIADQINKADPQIVNKKGQVIAGVHDLPRWINQPSAEYVREELVHQAVWSALTNGYIRLLATVRNGNPLFVYVGTSSVVSYTVNNGEIIYLDYASYGDDSHTIVADTIAIRRRFTLPGQPLGLSDFEPARTLLNTALHAQDAVDRFFGSNMFLDVIFSHDGEYVKGAGSELIEDLAKRHAGPRRAFRPIVTDRKWNIDRMKDSNQANQLVELLGMVNTAISTQIFGIDPLVFSLSTMSLSSTTLTYQNASNLRSQVWLQAVEPVADLIAGVISDYLPSGQYFRFSAADMLRGSPADRGQLVANMALVNKHQGRVVFSDEDIREVLGYRGELPTQPMSMPDSVMQKSFDSFTHEMRELVENVRQNGHS